jgi:hypothetical protein
MALAGYSGRDYLDSGNVFFELTSGVNLYGDVRVEEDG